MIWHLISREGTTYSLVTASSDGKSGASPSLVRIPGEFLSAPSQNPELTLSAVIILARSSLFCIIKLYHFRSNELLSCKRNNKAEK